MDVELKSWLDLSDSRDRANLAKALLALANHGGGWVLIGFRETGGAWEPDSSRPEALESYGQDAINAVVARFAEPSFHCSVAMVEHPAGGGAHPVIRVPGGHRRPIRARRGGPGEEHVRQNDYYIRRPGPASEPPRSGHEWDQLIDRCIRAGQAELLDAIREILAPGSLAASTEDAPTRERLSDWIAESQGRFQRRVAEAFPAESPSRYVHGVYTIAYEIDAISDHPSLALLREILAQSMGSETGWPAFMITERDPPRAFQGVLECLLASGTMFTDAAHSDFWRAAPDGRMFLLRGYDDDSSKRRAQSQPGTQLEVILPIWRTAEPLLHAHRVASALGVPEATLHMRVDWHGLQGRILTSWAGPDHVLLPHRREAFEDDITSEIEVSTMEIRSNLPEVVLRLTRPLYETFRLFEIPPTTVQRQLERLTSGTG